MTVETKLEITRHSVHSKVVHNDITYFRFEERKLSFDRVISREVEWELEDGSLVAFHKDRSTNGWFVRDLGYHQPEPEVEKLFQAQKQKPYVIKNFNQQLYVCGRDVQMGDTVIYMHQTGKVEETMQSVKPPLFDIVEEKGGRIFIYAEDKKNVFRPLGTVSPEALWIKDGDEFTFEELMAQGVGVNWSPVRTGWKFTLKGPCGHFH
jgi:hypothetical protein